MKSPFLNSRERRNINKIKGYSYKKKIMSHFCIKFYKNQKFTAIVIHQSIKHCLHIDKSNFPKKIFFLIDIFIGSFQISEICLSDILPN